MKIIVLVVGFLCGLTSLSAQNTDLPGPTSNLQALPSGSYVIAMDNTLQVNNSGSFNLKAYGLIVYLLNNNVHIKWSIKAGKAKDATDFTALAEQIKPTLVAGGVSRNFKAGPFIIMAADTTGVGALIDAFYSANSLTGTDRPQVYRLTADAGSVDIRYDLAAFRPKAAILTDGGNQSIHLAYMTAAAIPTESYSTSGGSNLIANCYTFASEPHNTKTGTAVNDAISSIRDFVTHGGNFLAQCEAINNYENNTLGRFQTTDGISVANTSVGTNLNYANPDLSFSQFEGDYNASQGGSVRNWKILGSPINNEHDHASGTGSNSTSIGASVAKLYYDKGGLVFYIGNHSFSTSTATGINGIRMYMNAFLTPSNTNCPSQLFSPLGVKLVNFSLQSKQKRARLLWTVANNEAIDHFEVERSEDGRNFVKAGLVSATTRAGNENYAFSQLPEVPTVYYRIKIVEKQGGIHFSPTHTFSRRGNNGGQLIVLSNPIRQDLALRYETTEYSAIKLTIYNSWGASVYTVNINTPAAMNTIIVPGSYMQAKGIYYIEVTDSRGDQCFSKVVRL